MTDRIIRNSEVEEYYFQEGCFIRELVNDPENDGISIAQARVKPGVITRWHWLQETTERYVILQGEGLVEVGDDNPESVSRGDVVVIPPMIAQRITNTGTGDLIFMAICTPRFKQSNYQEIDK